MFSFRKSVIAAVAVGMIFTFGACKRGGDGVTAQGLTSSWKVDDVNSLLEYVPEDAPVVFASTRNFSIDSPAMKALLEKSLAVYEKGFDAIAKAGNDNDADKKAIDAMKGSMASVMPLLKNYPEEAVNWGLQPKGHQDSVVFVAADHFVAHQTVVDGAKLKVKVNELLSGLKIEDQNAFKLKEIGSGDNAWTLLQPDTVPNVDTPIPAFAIHYGKNLVTVTIVDGKSDPDVNALAALLKPAAKGISKDALGKIGNDEIAVGFVDGAKMIDKGDLKKLQELHSQTVSLKSAKTMASLALNLKLDKAISFFSDLGKAMDAKQFKCEALQRMTAQALSFQEVAANPDVPKYASALSSINVVVDAFDLKAQKADASIVISGDKLGELMPELSSMLTALGTPIDLKKDEVTNFDLTPLTQWPLVLDMTYSDKDLAIATSGHDVKAMTKLSKSASKSFIDLDLSYSLFSIISKEDMGNAFGSVGYGIAIGTDDEGLRFTITSRL